MSEDLRERLTKALHESQARRFIEVIKGGRSLTNEFDHPPFEDIDAVFAEIEAAGYVLVERELLERIGLALWSMIGEEDYRDEILGLQPGDRAAIPGALTGRVGG